MKQSKISKSSNLFIDIGHLIEESKQNVARQINSAMSLLYWNIGHRIRTDGLNNQRQSMVKQIVATLAKNLSEEYGKGWSEQQLRHCLNTVEKFSG